MNAFLRLLMLAGALVAALASSSSSSNAPDTAGPGDSQSEAPPSQPMDPAMALGLWKSSFGPVKLEYDDSQGAGHLMGVWAYDRNGQEVVGFFSGPVQGNVLDFEWQEPTPDGNALRGSGYLVFDVQGQSFSGRWWSENRDRGGEWSGWRGPEEPAGPESGGAEGYPPPGPETGAEGGDEPVPPEPPAAGP